MSFDDIVVNSQKFSVVIRENVLNLMLTYIQCKCSDPESGGILTGEVYEDKIVITDCSEPNSYDKQSRYNFLRSKRGAQPFLNDKFLKSGGRDIYLGEWHTHPENEPIPSHIDKINFQQSLKINFINSDHLLMIILGLKAIYLRHYKKGQFINEHLFYYNSMLKK